MTSSSSFTDALPRSTNHKKRGILKKEYESFIDVRDELEPGQPQQPSPEKWFQQLISDQNLSPLDLCDTLCFGDAHHHKYIPLKHVCEILFQLDPRNTTDPLTPSMEEFLYKFSFDQGDGEIVIDIKEALRTLDIWKPRPTANSPHKKNQIQSASSTANAAAAVSPAKAAVLQVKAEQLHQVISNLQHENGRLSRALRLGGGGGEDRDDTDKSDPQRRGGGDIEEQEDDSQRVRPPSPLKFAVKQPVALASSSSSSSSSPSSPHHQQKQPPRSPPVVVTRHEQQLVNLANRLEYTGVKRLEELLLQATATTSNNNGFVSVKLLQYLLTNECSGLEPVSEPQLMEWCLGMNFNSHGQVDAKEFIRVLLDILLYEPRSHRPTTAPASATADTKQIAKIRDYFRGVDAKRAKTRELLDVLCDKYDLEGNHCLSLTEMVNVFQVDLPHYHIVQLKWPLTLKETRQLFLSLSPTPQDTHDTSSVFLYYPPILDALFRSDATTGNQSQQQQQQQALVARLLDPLFWRALRDALCPQEKTTTTGHRSTTSHTQKVHTQLCKILMKLDPQQRFLIAERHFVRVFDQHWSARDVELLVTALSPPLSVSGSIYGSISSPVTDAPVYVRYDILMKLVFGAPELRDGTVLNCILHKLSRETRHELEEQEQEQQQSVSKHRRMTYRDAYKVFGSELNLTEFLYLVAHIKSDQDDRFVDASKLWTLLASATSSSSQDGTSSSFSGSSKSSKSSDFALLKSCLRVLCDDYDLETALHKRAPKYAAGVARVEDLTQEMLAQLRILQLAPHDKALVLQENNIQAFLCTIRDDAEGTFEVSPTNGDSLYIHAVMDALFDWDALTSALGLPDRLVDAKQTLALFDWDKDGSIELNDWAKAYRQLATVAASKSSSSSSSSSSAKRPVAAAATAVLRDWEMRVLVRRFPGTSSDQKKSQNRISGTGTGSTMDYSRLLVFLLDRQQRLARESLLNSVLRLLHEVCGGGHGHGQRTLTTMQLEKVFSQLDRDGKGYFTIRDLKEFILQQKNKLRFEQLNDASLEYVMKALIGDKSIARKNHTKNQPTVVSLMRFQELVNHQFAQPESRGRSRPESPSHSHSHHRSHHHHNRHHDHEYDDEDQVDNSNSSATHLPVQQITLLRDLTQCVWDISHTFVGAKGKISPCAAFAHLCGVPRNRQDDRREDYRRSSSSPTRRPRSQSPVRTSSSGSSSSQRRSSWVAAPPRSPHHLSSGFMEPLTASKLKRQLRQLHRIETSTHLLGQFFVYIGCPSRHFLELKPFATWLTPLSMDFHTKIKTIVKEMLIKNKSGGGQVDIERFLSAVERRLGDASAQAAAAMVAPYPFAGASTNPWDRGKASSTVQPTVLLSCLHHMNVPLRRPEMDQLLRHFAMENELEIDFALFIRRMYELAMQIPGAGSG